jgi:hypothetical protein
VTTTVRLSEGLPFEEHLALEVRNKARERDFDMNDRPEVGLPDCPLQLQIALRWLSDNVEKEWILADAQALQSQEHHRRLARIAIFSGTSAIVLAIMQLATSLTFPSVTHIVLRLEATAVITALCVVIIGAVARVDRRWLGHRHRAERLRMLKFRALEKLWCFDDQKWEQWVATQLRDLQGAASFHLLEKWSEEEDVEGASSESAKRDHDPAFAHALTALYRFKRLAFQADYFQRRQSVYQRQTRGWRHLALPLFFASIVCVLAHFIFETWSGRLASPEVSHVLAVWFVALAAIIPVVGVGVRAWFAAFELPRSASLFGAKYHALIRAMSHLEQDSGDISATQRHMAQTERFLENEHREWLRLLRDTEWFL